MRTAVLAAFFAVSFCTMSVVLPAGFVANSSNDNKVVNNNNLNTIGSVAAYTTDGTPKANFIADKTYAGVFNKKAATVVIVVDDAEIAQLPKTVSERQTMHLRDEVVTDADEKNKNVEKRLASVLSLGESTFASFEKEPTASETQKTINFVANKFGDVDDELVAKTFEKQTITVDNVEFSLEKDKQFLYELTFLKNLKNLPKIFAVVLKAHKSYEGEKRAAALKAIDETIAEIRPELEKTSSVQVATIGKTVIRVKETMKRESSESSSSSSGSIVPDEVYSPNYTGLAWISITTVIVLIAVALVGSWMMVGVGEDCAKDTLLARSY